MKIDPVLLIRQQHEQLTPDLADLETAAAEMATSSDDGVRRQLSAVTGFLRDHLVAHMEAEERDLYPAVGRLLRSLGSATKTMSRDHDAINEKVEALERLSKSTRQDSHVDPLDRAEAARLLYGLAALLENHFAKEEEVYLPLLEQGLSPEEAEQLARQLATQGS